MSSESKDVALNVPPKKKMNWRGRPGGVLVTQTAERKARFIEAYRASGTIYVAAKSANVARETVFTWKEKDPAFLKAFLQAEVELVEHLETKAVEIAKNGDANMVQWLLKCLNRGKYSDRIRHEFESKTMDLVITEILVVLQNRIPSFCPHCRTGLDISPVIAQDLLAMSSALVTKEVIKEAVPA